MIIYNLQIKSIDELEIVSKYALYCPTNCTPKTQHLFLPTCPYATDDCEYVIDVCEHRTFPLPRKVINGVYIIFKEGEIIRIGQSKDVYKRLRSHNKPNSPRYTLQSAKWDSFAIIECDSDIDKFIIEGILVYMYKPEFNKKMLSKV